MKITALAALIATFAVPAFAAEQFAGTHTYRHAGEVWRPVRGAGWWTSTMVGDYVPTSGPIPASRVACRGTGYWHGTAREADEVCVFGEGGDVWMLRYRMTRNDTAAPTAERHRRIASGQSWAAAGDTVA